MSGFSFSARGSTNFSSIAMLHWGNMARRLGRPSRLLSEDPHRPAGRAGRRNCRRASLPGRREQGVTARLASAPRPGSRGGRLSASGAAPTALRGDFSSSLDHAAMRRASPAPFLSPSLVAASSVSSAASSDRFRPSSASNAKAPRPARHRCRGVCARRRAGAGRPPARPRG